MSIVTDRLDRQLSDVEWKELTVKEQLAFLRQGYKPPEGTIIHGNGDIEILLATKEQQ